MLDLAESLTELGQAEQHQEFTESRQFQGMLLAEYDSLLEQQQEDEDAPSGSDDEEQEQEQEQEQERCVGTTPPSAPVPVTRQRSHALQHVRARASVWQELREGGRRPARRQGGGRAGA